MARNARPHSPRVAQGLDPTGLCSGRPRLQDTLLQTSQETTPSCRARWWVSNLSLGSAFLLTGGKCLWPDVFL